MTRASERERERETAGALGREFSFSLSLSRSLSLSLSGWYFCIRLSNACLFSRADLLPSLFPFFLLLCVFVRPFVRKLPEFKFWVKSAKSLLVSFSMTFFPVFDVPVFWPILLMYFIMLFTMTMKQQLRHMIKHKYVPFSWGKQTYGKGSGGGKEKSGGSD